MNKQKELFDLNWKKNFEKINTNLQVDSNYKNHLEDGRLCFTLLVKIPNEFHKNISQKINELKLKFPDQFFYPVDRTHFTVIGLIQIKEKLVLGKKLLNKLIPLIKNVLSNYSPFEVGLNGLNITPISVFIQGFYDENTLDTIRKDLISEIKKEDLGLDLNHVSSYDLGYAWSTIMRFTNKNVSELLGEIKKLRNFKFGKFTVKEIQLVTTDKYFSEKKTKIISSFYLY